MVGKIGTLPWFPTDCSVEKVLEKTQTALETSFHQHSLELHTCGKATPHFPAQPALTGDHAAGRSWHGPQLDRMPFLILKGYFLTHHKIFINSAFLRFSSPQNQGKKVPSECFVRSCI